MSAASNSQCPVCRTAEVVCGKWTLLADPRPRRGQQPLLRAGALAGGDQPAHALAAPAGAGGGGDRRAPHLSRGAAAGRVRADREGRGAGAADRRHAHATARAGCSATPTPSPPPSRSNVQTGASARRSCRRRSAGPAGGSVGRARLPPQRSAEAARHRGGDPLQRAGRRAATRSPSTSPPSSRRRLALLQLRAADRRATSRARGRAALAARLRPGPRRGRSRPASPPPTWRPAASRSRPTRASAPRRC